MIGVLGLWHLGTVYSACLAELGQHVLAFDSNEERVKDLQAGVLPVFEPGLAELVTKHHGSGFLRFTSDMAALSQCEVFWLAADTSLLDNGEPDMKSLEHMLVQCVPYLRKSLIFIVSSQVPIGTSDHFVERIQRLRPDINIQYAYQPENLQLGQALKSFFEPTRIVVGTDSGQATDFIKKIFAPLQTTIQVMRPASAEMVKHALNAFLGTSLSFIYDIADLCEAYGADVLDVSRALKSDPRIGPASYLDASLGFSGGTLNRDLTVLVEKARAKAISVPVVENAAEKNKERWKMLITYLDVSLSKMSTAIIGILGMTYKAGTTTLRDSLSVKVGTALKDRVQEIRCHDPLATASDIMAAGPFMPYSEIYEMAEGCEVIIVMTNSSEYAKLDWKKIAGAMVGGKIIFDAKNVLWEQEGKIKSQGLSYRGIGRGINSV